MYGIGDLNIAYQHEQWIDSCANLLCAPDSTQWQQLRSGRETSQAVHAMQHAAAAGLLMTIQRPMEVHVTGSGTARLHVAYISNVSFPCDSRALHQW